MWTRVTQDDSANACFFGTPTLEDGQELPAALFTSGDLVNAERLSLPVVHPGAVSAISLAMDSIPILNESAASFFSEHFGEAIQLIPCTSQSKKKLWVANILTVCDCMDYSATHAEFYPNNYPLEHLRGCVKTAIEIAVKQTKVGGYDMFRVASDKVRLISTLSFLETLTTKGLTGLATNAYPRYRPT